MSAFGEFNLAVMNAANTVNNVMSDFAKRKSDFQLSTNSINFQDQLNYQLREMEKNNGWKQGEDGSSQWEKDIDNFYQEKLDALTDENSPFFAHNQYEYRAMQEMIQQSRVSTMNKVSQMAWQKQGEQMIIDYNNSLEQLRGIYQGQDYIDQANAGAKQLMELGLVSPEQYDTLLKNNFTTGYYTYYSNQFDAALDQGIKEGKTFDALYSSVVNGKDGMKLIGDDGMEIKVDKEVIGNQLKKYKQQEYNAKLNQIQSENYDWHDNKIGEGHALITRILTGENVDLQEIYNIANLGQSKLQTQTGLQLPKGQNEALSKEYEALVKSANGLFELSKGGSGSTRKAAEKFDPETIAKACIDQAKRGTLSELGGRSSFYKAYEVFKDKAMFEFQKFKIKKEGISEEEEASRLNWKDMEEEASRLNWKDMEEEFPAVNNFFELAAKELPPSLQGLVNNAKTVTKTLLTDNKTAELFETYWPNIQDVITDLLYEVDVSKLDGASLEELRKRSNTAILGMLGSVLNSKKVDIYGEEYKVPGALDNYKQGINLKQEAKDAAALMELQNNPDLYYVPNGKTTPEFTGSVKTKEGITNLTNNLKNEVAKIIENSTGKNIDPSKIEVVQETYDDNKYDVKSTPVFKWGGNTYRAITEDGKTIQYQELKKSIVEDKNGKKKEVYNWETVRSDKEEKEYNKPENIVKRYLSEKDITEMPPVNINVNLGGGRSIKLTEALWKNSPSINRRQILIDFYNKDPEAAERYFNSLPESEKKQNYIKDSKR